MPGARLVCLIGLALPAVFAVRGARADAMDPAVGNLALACGPTSTRTCPDVEAFERLASELLIATLAPPMGPARALPAHSLGLGISSVATLIDTGADHWRRGSEGTAESAPGRRGYNGDPMPALVWNRIEATMGLVYGLEAGVDLGQGLLSSFWTPGLSLKWAVVQGYRRTLVPDVALRLAVNRSVGSRQLDVQLASVDLAVSRRLVLGDAWSLTPFIGGQLAVGVVAAGVVDLTPGTDALSICQPAPNEGAEINATPTGEACRGSASDFGDHVVFRDVDQLRLRAVLGAEVALPPWRARVCAGDDVVAPQVEGGDGLRQLAFALSLGVVL